MCMRSRKSTCKIANCRLTYDERGSENRKTAIPGGISKKKSMLGPVTISKHFSYEFS